MLGKPTETILYLYFGQTQTVLPNYFYAPLIFRRAHTINSDGEDRSSSLINLDRGSVNSNVNSNGHGNGSSHGSKNVMMRNTVTEK